MKRGKKYLEAVKNVDQAALYDPQEACAIVKKLWLLQKFDETIEASSSEQAVTVVMQISRSEEL